MTGMHEVRLVTIISDRKTGPGIVAMLRECGVSGYTAAEAHGNQADLFDLGASGASPARMRFEVVAEPLLAGALIQEIAHRFFGQAKVIVFEQSVRVVRPGKFGKRESSAA